MKSIFFLSGKIFTLYFFLIFSLNAKCSNVINDFFIKIDDKQIVNDSILNYYPTTFKINRIHLENLINCNEIIIKEFPISQEKLSSVHLVKIRSIIDDSTKILTGDGVLLQTPSMYRYKGEIQNIPNSEVFLTIVNDFIFCRVINDSGEDINIMPLNANLNEYIIVKSSESINKQSFNCYAQEPPNLKAIEENNKKENHLLSKNILVVDIALEACKEWYLWKFKNDTLKIRDYILSVYSMVSYFYEKEINITIRIPWFKIWTVADPYDTGGDSLNWGGDPYQLLTKVSEYWKTHNLEVKANLVHAVTVGSRGGIAYYGALASDLRSGIPFAGLSLDGNYLYPSLDFSFDVHTTAHELGHNFNCPHTHSCYWNPPIDTCETGEGIESGCLQPSQQRVPNSGSIMSYCREINNWVSEMTFLSAPASYIRSYAETYLKPFDTKYIKLVNPYISKIYKPLDTIFIEWRSSNINKINIKYSDNGGITWEIIKDSVEAVDEVFKWLAPNLCNNIIIKVTNTEDPKDESILITPIKIIEKDSLGLIAFYPFNGNSKDEQLCHFNNAYGVNNPSLSKDKNGKDSSAYYFSSNCYLKSENFNIPIDALTVSFWLNPENLSGDPHHIVGTNYQESWAFSVYFWGAFGASYYIDGRYGPSQIYGGGLPLNSWSHGVFTFDGRYAKLYLNGILQNTVDEGTPNHKINYWSDKPLYIGSRNGEEGFVGSIDQVKIFDKALSEEEIVDLFNEPISSPNKTLLAYPLNNSIDQDIDIFVEWKSLSEASSYNIIMSKDYEFTKSNIIIDTVTTDTVLIVEDLLYNQNYYWKVQGINQLGSGDWSEIWNFETINGLIVKDLIENKLDEVIFYPNPAENHFNLQINSVNCSKIKVKILNTLSAIVFDSEINTNELLTFSSEHLSRGLHIIIVENCDGLKYKIKKIIFNK